MREELIKNKKRIVDHGEVFTSKKEVNAMLELVKGELERIDSTFLEPACGNGNFLDEILARKLNIVENVYGKSQFEYERYSIIAISSLYGVDIQIDNCVECRKRLLETFRNRYIRLFQAAVKSDCLRSAAFILKMNIIWGDALYYTNPETKAPIVFSEWKAINGSMIKRMDFDFQFLVKKTYQTSLFDENNDPKFFDNPIKEYPIVHFLKLGELPNE